MTIFLLFFFVHFAEFVFLHMRILLYFCELLITEKLLELPYMINRTTCSNRQMKKMNVGSIFTYLNKKGSASRIELSRSLDLDRKTITNLVRDLIASNLLISKGFRQPRMGPPEEILAINPHGGYAIGVTVEPRQISASLVNLYGKIKKRNVKPILPTDSTA